MKKIIFFTALMIGLFSFVSGSSIINIEMYSTESVETENEDSKVNSDGNKEDVASDVKLDLGKEADKNMEGEKNNSYTNFSWKIQQL